MHICESRTKLFCTIHKLPRLSFNSFKGILRIRINPVGSILIRYITSISDSSPHARLKAIQRLFVKLKTIDDRLSHLLTFKIKSPSVAIVYKHTTISSRKALSNCVLMQPETFVPNVAIRSYGTLSTRCSILLSN